MQKAILIISHGSKSFKTIEEVKFLVQKIKEKTGLAIVEFGFLELMSPSIEEGFTACVKQGASHVSVLLNFLNSGKHVDEDIPHIVDGLQKSYPVVEVKLSSPVGQHPGIVALFADLVSF